MTTDSKCPSRVKSREKNEEIPIISELMNPHFVFWFLYRYPRNR